MLTSDELGNSSTKAKFSVTPPSSPTSSFSANPNVFNNNSYSPSPRLASDDGDGGVDGFFKFLGDDYPDVFTITNGNVNNDTLSRPQKPSQSPKAESREGTLPGNRGSNFSEDKYKWNDTDTCANTDKKKKAKKSRKICLIVLVILLVLALIGVGLAVILVYKVFDVGEAEEVVGPTTDAPEILTLEGSLDLKATWTIELSDKNSTLFKNTADNFTKEMDRLMEDSPYNESYISTNVIEMSKGSIKIKYRMLHNNRYKLKARTGPQFAVLVEDHIKRKSSTSDLPIDKDTIEIYVKFTTPSSTSTPTSSVTTSTISTPANTTASMPPSTTTPSTTTSSTTTSSTTTPSTTTSSTTTSSTTTSSTITSSTTTPSTTTSSTTTPSTTTSSTTTSSTTTPSTTTSSTTTSPITTPSTTTTSTTTSSTTTPSTTTSSTTTSSTTTPSTTTSSTTTSSTTTSTTSSTSTTTVPDHPPIANAGPDVEVTLPTSSVELDGSGSTDDHGIVLYRWESVTPLDASVILEGTNNAVLRIKNLVDGVYRFRLTVTDKLGQTSEDTALVNVKPEPTTTTTTKVTTAPPDLCLPVNFTTCRDLGFVRTVLPNLFGHETEEDAIAAFNLMAQTVHNQVCQDVTLTYICSLHFPQCDPTSGYMVFPCKSLCTTAVSTCDDYFSNPFDCSYFSESDCVSMSTTTPPPTTPFPMGECEPTFHKQCLELGFNETQFPNFLQELRQTEANITFSYFSPDLEPAFCHKDALFFICSVQFPRCVNGTNQKPCRRTCKAVAAVCEIIGLFMTCDDFPEIDCVAPPEPVPECGKDEFTCNTVNKCVYQDKVCNRVNDCGDYSDEMDCTCGEYEFQCTMGMCIKSYQKCDGTAQCPDSSDEDKNICGNCTHGQVQCPDGKCIMAEWMCDDRAECSDGWDEFNCDVCRRNQFMCKDRSRTCIPIEKACDRIPDCPDGYDEWSCIKDGKGFLQLRYKKQWMSVCSDYWDDQFGNYTCTELLGKGNYIGKTDIVQNVYKYIKLGSGNLQSVLGPMDITSDCQSRKVVKVNCEARGCGKQMIDVENKIVNGEVAAKGAWPWHVALYFAGQYFCGGTLINENFVLTAAHCVDGVVYSDHSRMTVKLGANNREQWETTQHVIRVEAIESHSEHVYFKKNDIALLQLESPVNFTDYIQPVCLPERGDPLPLYSTCFTVGWGKTKWDGEYAEVLQQLKMTLWDTQKCNSSVAWDGEVYDTFLCAGYYSGIRSICKGDSGGPLLCMDKSETWKIFGVASYVANFCNMTERPNIYTNVTQLLPWIAEKTECKFRCDNGKCLYYKEYICDRNNDCGDNSDETRPCNRTVSCDFEDKYLCGYNFSGWNLGYDNKQAASVQIDGQWHTQSNAPQYDHTLGRYPGQFFYGKNKDVRDAELWSPWFDVSGQTCIRFSYYQRGEIKLGLSVYVRWDESGSDTTTPWSSGAYYAVGEWKTGFFDLTLGRYQIVFKTGDLLKTAIDDVIAIPGMCQSVLCNSDEFRCKGPMGESKCIPKRSRCNLAVDCDDYEYSIQSDEKSCTAALNNYKCTFDNGNLCALHQEVGDASDWWLVNASFVRKETGNKKFVDHTKSEEGGHLFYINAYGLQTSKHITMWQMFYLHSRQYCFSFFYQMKSNVTFNIHVDCDGCVRDTHVAQSTFDDNWTLWQLNLPPVEVVNITYDVVGNSLSEGFFRSFIALDDIYIKAGVCPEYECRPNYTKCRSYDRCIPQAALCNRTVDCLDESDEEQCECREDEYKCLSGRCVSLNYFCDRTPQCLDGSDEGDVCLPLQNVSCTFEHPYMCGYDLVRTTDFHWQRYKGQTPTPVTGPKADHTYGTPEGYYMYTEANQGDKNDSASLLSPIFNTQVGQSVHFFYHMYSSQWYDTRAGLLELSFFDVDSKVISVQWQAPVIDLQDTWREVCIDLPDNVNIRLNFTSMRTEQSTYGTDMAIDDVSVNREPCFDVTGSTMRTTSSTAGAFSCGNGQWMCANTMCINENYKCDGYGDCTDNSDEWDCP